MKRLCCCFKSRSQKTIDDYYDMGDSLAYMMLHLHPTSDDDEPSISMLECIIRNRYGDLPVARGVGEVFLEVGLPELLEVVVEAHDGPSGGDDDEDLLVDVGPGLVGAVDGADGHGDGAPAGGDANVGREEGDLGHEARLAEVVEGGGGVVGGPRGLEDLDGGVVGWEQDLGPAVAVEVGNERRREAVGVVLDRVPVVREVVPRLPEREVALVLVDGGRNGLLS